MHDHPPDCPLPVAPAEPTSLEARLLAFTLPDADPLACLQALVAQVRPADPRDGEKPVCAIRAICHLLTIRPPLRRAFRAALVGYLAGRRATSLYVDAGLYPNRGFFSEAWRRLSHTLLPDATDAAYLRDVVAQVFDRASDATWVDAVDDAVWIELFSALCLEEAQAVEAAAANDGVPEIAWAGGEAAAAGHQLIADLLEALRVLSYRIAAMGLEPELLRVEPTLETHESPFLAQNVEVLALLDSFHAWLPGETAGAGGAPDDGRQLRVLFDQARALLERVRMRAIREGTSLSLSLLLQRLQQSIARCDAILDILGAYVPHRRLGDAAADLVVFCKTLVVAECRKNDLRQFWRSNVELLAHRVTDNAGRAGEHYITDSRSEYFGLFRSAALAGVVIALMALNKLFIGQAHLAPLNEVLAVCLNYGIGFVLIHVLHGTVATKQPAMTAAAIAASIGEAPLAARLANAGDSRRGKAQSENLERLAQLVARTTRSQLVAILGNISVAIPVAVLLGALFSAALAMPYPSAEKAQHLLADVHPWQSGALVFAAIAGVCLFLSGLIAGYYDNLAAYNRIPQRLHALRPLRRLLGEARLYRVSRYVEENLGALAANFFFGFLLGGVSGLGVLFGLPLDIRHIAFSSAHLGFSANALSFSLGWADLLREMAAPALGVALIGLVNLVVSFALSLEVAFRARQMSFAHSRVLLRAIWTLLRQRPRDFFLPPKKKAPALAAAAPPAD